MNKEILPNIVFISNVNYLWMLVEKLINLTLQKIKKFCFHKFTPIVIVCLLK